MEESALEMDGHKQQAASSSSAAVVEPPALQPQASLAVIDEDDLKMSESHIG